MYPDSVVRLRAGTKTNRAGDEVPDWTDPDRLPMDSVSVQPVSQFESLPTGTASGTGETVWTGRDQAVTSWRLYSQPGQDLDIKATDRLEFDDMTLEVVGEVARWRDPLNGAVHHVEVALQRATG